MNEGNALTRLARQLGITTTCLDRNGSRHDIQAETLRQLLEAMRLPMDQDPGEVLASLARERCRRVLPHVHVARVGQAIPIEVALPDGVTTRRHRWILRLEDGRSRVANFLPSALGGASGPAWQVEGFARRLLILPPVATMGYHRLDLEPADTPEQQGMMLIVAPASCYQPEGIRGDRRVWGPAAQVSALRSRRNWGCGDFTDVKNMVDIAADAGAGAVGIHDLHAVDWSDPARPAPSPVASRLFLNAMHLDVESLPELRDCPSARALIDSASFQAQLRSLRAEACVNEASVAKVKLEVLELLFGHFRDTHLARGTDRAVAFRDFVDRWNEALWQHSCFEALHRHLQGQGTVDVDWRTWPEHYRSPHSPQVKEFAAAHRNALEFSMWLQWSAESQLAEIGHQCWRRGLGVGLCQDLSAGVDPLSADAWRWQSILAIATRATLRSNAQSGERGGQPFIPDRLRREAYRPFIETLVANMRHAGALRILGASGLRRTFWRPEKSSGPQHGAYVSYPLRDLLGIIALESQRNQCLVIGDDVGSGSEAFQSTVAAHGILVQRSFLEERTGDGGYRPPADYPDQSLVSITDRERMELHEFWRGSDLDSRTAANLFPSDSARETEVIVRAGDRAGLLLALEREDLLPEGSSIHPVSVPELTSPFIDAMYAYLARSPCRILIVEMQDVLGGTVPANREEPVDDRWLKRRRLPLDMEEWRDDQHWRQLGEILRQERGTSVAPKAPGATPEHRAIIPRATYRLQFNRDFTFNQAAELIPYLAELGVSHCYASPYLKARPGSMHGYDIVDHTALNPEIGTPDEYERLIAAIRSHGMCHILDVVPNHMGVMGADNAWWLDVLENGPSSAYGSYFDIDWDPLNPILKGKVLLPLLGDHYGIVLERGELRLDFAAERGEFSLHYYQHRLPIDPATYPTIVGHNQERLIGVMGAGNPRFLELQSALTAFGHLPPRMCTDPAQRAERQRDKEVHKQRLAALNAADADIAQHIDENLREYNGRPGEGASFDLLHDLIQVQGYRPAFWRVASDEINYRRFFDINELAALRMEEPAVFEATHRFLLDLIVDGKVDGLRIDHPDGLYDPGQYFDRLQESIARRSLSRGEPLPAYLVIEKILANHERPRKSWAAHGTTGYEFANLTNALFVDVRSELRMTRIYHRFVSNSDRFDELVYHAKKLIMDTALAGELQVLATRLARIAASNRTTCDFTFLSLRDALAEVIAGFPVYRTYIGPSGPSGEDRRYIDWAIAIAKKRGKAGDISIFDFLRDVLTTDMGQGRNEDYRAAITAFAMQFQQLSAPVMAKGVEDTAFYRYHRLVSLNDVGGDPNRFGLSVSSYHAANRRRRKDWPHSLLATSTHDSKRSEDVRARLAVLSELPGAFKLLLGRWSRLNQRLKRDVEGVMVPTASDEFLLYQTLIGTWPCNPAEPFDLERYRVRIEEYMVKAVREAKEHTSWININEHYENALHDFIRALLSADATNPFPAEFATSIAPFVRPGLLNGLAQTLLKLTAPGVPDIYQGCELWQFTLVDPDNRRAVDFSARQRLLAEVKGVIDAPADRWPRRLRPLLDRIEDGGIKLYLIWRVLQLRKVWPEVFNQGDYLPIRVSGEHARHVCAYARRTRQCTILTAVPRLTTALLADGAALPLGEIVWQDTAIELPADLAQRRWWHVLTGRKYAPAPSLELGQLFRDIPVALLTSAIPPGDPLLRRSARKN